ncbi:hypothetical protein [Chryseobacterium sp. RLHN22]|uniref:hypothetical protein n=1 Tax=Chryseobacterium sp. RLHN22 TaxID=3437885 RepID=UPI003D9B391A
MNITNFIEKAINLDVNWRHYDFFDIIDELKILFKVSYEPSVEKIAMIELSNNIVGYINSNYPFVFIEDKFLTELKNILYKYDYIQYISIDSVNHKYLSIDRTLYDKYFNYLENTDRFSAEDFYFYNIT